MNESNPLVSIVTPSFNQAKYLEATITSVLTQDYKPLEYIIIDGGSTDGSLQILETYGEAITYWRSEPDAGQTEAINRGFARASGEVLAWLNSDDLYYPAAVRSAVLFLMEHPDVGMVYGKADYIDEAGEIVGAFPAAQTEYNKLRRGYVHIPQQAAFFRKSLWEQVRPLDTKFYFAMDYDLWIRLSSISSLHFEPEIWAAFRLHGAAKTSEAFERCWPEMLIIHRREGGGYISRFYLNYMIRRILGPFLPYRVRLRLWAHSLKSRWAETSPGG